MVKKHMGTFRDRETRKFSIIEAVNWVCANVQDDDGGVSEHSLVMHANEILGEVAHDIEVQCNVRCNGVSCGTVAPTNLNDDLLNDGCVLSH